MSIPDIDQVREALTQYQIRGATTAEAAAKAGIGTDLVKLIAVARAFVEGSLLPAKPDYEAAAEAFYEADDTLKRWTVS